MLKEESQSDHDRSPALIVKVFQHWLMKIVVIMFFNTALRVIINGFREHKTLELS